MLLGSFRVFFRHMQVTYFAFAYETKRLDSLERLAGAMRRDLVNFLFDNTAGLQAHDDVKVSLRAGLAAWWAVCCTPAAGQRDNVRCNVVSQPVRAPRRTGMERENDVLLEAIRRGLEEGAAVRRAMESGLISEAAAEAAACADSLRRGEEDGSG